MYYNINIKLKNDYLGVKESSTKILAELIKILHKTYCNIKIALYMKTQSAAAPEAFHMCNKCDV